MRNHVATEYTLMYLYYIHNNIIIQSTHPLCDGFKYHINTSTSQGFTCIRENNYIKNERELVILLRPQKKMRGSSQKAR